MSNTFDFNRFKKVLARDFHATYSRFGLAILIIVLLPIASWMMGLVTMSGEDSYYYGDYFCEAIRIRNFILGLFVAVAIAPGIIYKSCNLKGRGNYFALMPASVTEKYFSMFLYCCIVVPVVVVFGTLFVGTLLTLFPFGPFKEYFWQFDFFTQIDFEYWYLLYPIVYWILTASIFMFTNTIFKRAKFIKTVLWLWLIGFVVMLCAFAMNFISDLIGAILDDGLAMLWLPLVMSAVLQFFTYRRLKRMQY